MPASKYSREMPLNSWVEMFQEIYFPTQNYGRSKQEIFTHLVRVIGGGARYLFREDDNESSARAYLAKVFAWYCALAIRLGLSLDNVLWSKFPGVCPHCLEGRCQCGKTSREVDRSRLQVKAIDNQHLRPRTLRQWQALFATIYPGPLGEVEMEPSRDTVAITFARLTEELGEVAEAIDFDERVDAGAQHVVENEMADLLAWIFALANQFHLMNPRFHALSLPDVVWARYPDKCAACGDKPCNCVRGQYQAELASRGAMAPSHWDTRTGLANYRALDLYLERAMAEFREPTGSRRWGAIFFDLDDFGKLNKQYGHDAGDQVLQASAHAAVDVVGNAGFVFRRGGEEFVAILRGQTGPGTAAIAEAIRARLNGLAHTVEGEKKKPVTVHVTASLGVAATDESQDPMTMVDDAERRARVAKRRGKNCVVADGADEDGPAR